MPAVACRPLLPSFTPVGEEMGLNLLADVAASGKTQEFTKANTSLHQPGPYNPAAALPPKLVKRILALEFVDMSELRADVWPEEFGTGEGTSAGFRRPPSKPPITDIRIWTECYGRMATILASRFPEKAPELWAYQATISRATHNYEGGNWIAYDRQYRREMLAKGDLNWSSPNARLYNEAFTGRARAIPRCTQCLSEDHTTPYCQFMPPSTPLPYMPLGHQQTTVPPYTQLAPPMPSTGQRTICRNFNDNRCRYTRCRFQHVCSECGGPHPAIFCSRPRPTGKAPTARNRFGSRGHPYPYTGPTN